MNDSLVALRSLIAESIRVHPGDCVRVESLIKRISIILDAALEKANGKEDLAKIGEVLHELETTQYYIYSEVLRRINNRLKAMDAIQCYKWMRLSRRLGRKL